MSDIVERLRALHDRRPYRADPNSCQRSIYGDAADEIDHLREEIELRDQFFPFSREASVDAARWRYVRDRCWAQTMDGGRVGFGFEVCYRPRGGATVDEAVDAAIAGESEK